MTDRRGDQISSKLLPNSCYWGERRVTGSMGDGCLVRRVCQSVPEEKRIKGRGEEDGKWSKDEMGGSRTTGKRMVMT
jgi:hypothetical protein